MCNNAIGLKSSPVVTALNLAEVTLQIFRTSAAVHP
jgi:hypothetical protein